MALFDESSEWHGALLDSIPEYDSEEPWEDDPGWNWEPTPAEAGVVPPWGKSASWLNKGKVKLVVDWPPKKS